MFETKPTTNLIAFPTADARDTLTPILREGAQKMLATAIELEARAWLEERASLLDENGRRLVVRNGHQPTRPIISKTKCRASGSAGWLVRPPWIGHDPDGRTAESGPPEDSNVQLELPPECEGGISDSSRP